MPLPADKKITIPERYSAVKAKKILLLEDDRQFKTIIKEFLESNFYDVIAVENGGDGVREVVKQDFDIVICDMMMPNLPGDMFYTAVERMRPHLCPRFIFITGHRGNPKVTDFIKRVNGTMLAKPFHVDDLLETIAFIQVKSCIR